MADVYVTFGGESGELEASLAAAKASVNAFASELRGLAKEMQETGAAADSELGQKMQAVGANLAEAKAGVSSLKTELKGLGEGGGEAGGIAGIAEGITASLAPIAAVKESLAGLAEVFVAVFAVEKVGEFISSMGELGEATERTAAILGITTEQVGELKFAFASTGTNAENLDQMMGRFELSLSEAEKGTGKVAAGLRALGLSARELIGLQPDQQLRKIAEATAQFADGANKMAALQALGRGFVELIPLLDKGAEGFDNLKQISHETNSVLGAETTEALSNMQHGFVELGAAIQGDGVAGFGPFINSVNGAVKILTDLAEGFSNSVKLGGDMKGILDLLAWGFQQTEQFIGESIEILKNFGAAGDTSLKALTVSWQGFRNYASASFQELGEEIPKFFEALLAAGKAAVEGVGKQFTDLGTVIGDVFSLKFGDANAALANFGKDFSESMSKIGSSFGGVIDTTKSDAALKATRDALVKVFADGDKQIVENARVGQEEFNRIWGQGAEAITKQAPTKQTPNLDIQKDGAADKAARDALEAQMEADQAEVKSATDAGNAKIALYAKEAQSKQITEGQMLSLSLAALREELTAQEAALNKELQLDGLRPQQRQKILDQIKQLEQKNAEEVSKLQEQAAAKATESWNSAMNSINGAFTGQISGLLKGTTTFHQAFINALESLTEKTIKFFADWGLQIIENQARQLLGIGTVSAAQTSADAASLASHTAAAAGGALVDAGAMLKQIAASAATAFAGVTGFLSPIMGPAALGPAAATEAAVMAAGAGVMSADIGAYNLPADQLAMVHKNELIMPAAQAGAFRSMLEGGGQNGGGGDTHFHFNGTIIGTQQWIESMKQQLTKAVASGMTQNPSWRPKY